MAEPNYSQQALKALLGVMKAATPEHQPSEHVLRAFVELLTIHKAPDDDFVRQMEARLREVESNLRSVPVDGHPGLGRMRRMAQARGS